MRILVVDDSESFLAAIRVLLGQIGFEDVVARHSGAEAIEFLRSGSGRAPVDLVLMDLMMPEMDGIEAVRGIRSIESETVRDVPVIMVSGQDDEKHIERAFEAGAIDYMGKPPKKYELRARVNSALRLKEEMDRRMAHQRELEILNDVLERANRELQRLSTVDALTGLANRRHFNGIMKREWMRARRDGKSLAVLLADIDYFKAYNDHFGHVRGDSCLERVAGALTCALKRGGDLLARYGGEEFVAVLPDTEVEGARMVAETMRERVAALEIEHPMSLAAASITVSVGVSAVVPTKEAGPSALVEAADRALYRAKSLGRNRIAVGSPEVTRAAAPPPSGESGPDGGPEERTWPPA